MIKHSLNFDLKKPDKFITALKDNVADQHKNEDGALFNKGSYKVAPRFENFCIDGWWKLSYKQRIEKIESFINAGISDKNNLCLSLSVEEANIQSIPKPVIGNNVCESKSNRE